jgi:hypothetical protein
MDSHQAHGRPAYRCRHGHSSAKTRPANSPRNLYLREDHLLDRIAELLTAAGIATNPTREQTALLAHELGLAFVCNSDTITLHQPTTTPSTTSRDRVTGPTTEAVPATAAPITEPGHLTANFPQTSVAPTSVHLSASADSSSSDLGPLDLCLLSWKRLGETGFAGQAAGPYPRSKSFW